MAVLKTLTKLWISIYLNRSTYSLEESLKIENNQNQNKQNWKKDKCRQKQELMKLKFSCQIRQSWPAIGFAFPVRK